MPELPEVQTLIEDLKRSQIEGLKIVEVHVLYPKSVVGDAAFFKGKALESLARHGKFILFHLSGGQLAAIHLRMSGRLNLIEAGKEPDPHARAVFILSNEQKLVFSDTRKFGRIYIDSHASSQVAALGPDAHRHAWSEHELLKLMSNRRVPIKGLLLDQRQIAGIGNIYADEILFLSKLHPLRLAQSLTVEELTRLKEAIKRCLGLAIHYRGTSIGYTRNNFASTGNIFGQNQMLLNVYHRHELSCTLCHTLIQRMKVAGRSTHFCPICQPLL
ncbi:MAG: mutM [Chlamydiales bacterium]|jgi:formamidopyrimidine-DNA glycosylase|nr:mutM [Chlamydiales bacterium]